MSAEFAIETRWEPKEEGSPEERNCFAEIGITARGAVFTRASGVFHVGIRDRVFLSAYHLAEWLAWNWWRLRWEPRADDRAGWAMAHRLRGIGGGYVWPNLEVFSDGFRVALLSKPTKPSATDSLTYLSDDIVFIMADEFEKALDGFFDRINGHLRAAGVKESNFSAILGDLRAERQDPELSLLRRMEARMGHDPEQAPEDLVRRLVAEGKELGADAVEELAAGTRDGGMVPDASELRELSQSQGFELRSSDQVRLRFLENGASAANQWPAWVLGVKAAAALRQEQALGQGPLDSGKLAELCGIGVEALKRRGSAPLSFALGEASRSERVVLRVSPHPESRRFDLARVLGDRLAFGGTGRLFPATRSYTYRQQLQRAFAAQLLCPYEALKERLAGDFSAENQEEAADQFRVSVRVVEAILKDHGDLPRAAVEAVEAA